ncbi:CGNR zinc finger domain-containing protein [Micromonospora sp. NPDC051296]|uniref:CGNR zinc finger domain-containing protein n=1 Tax=Micromonospora sp. NPDC051296 TaxID=3155046 RepID=UPI003413C487
MATRATGLTLVSHDGARFFFDPGALCLEFLTTGGPGELARWEVLHQPGDLTAWLAQSRLRLDPAQVTVNADELAAARRLRDALWRFARARAAGQPAPAADLATVNDLAAPAPLVPRLTAGTGTDTVHSWALPATGTHTLATIARDAVDLFSGPYADRIRECGGHCYLIFVDTSRPGRRRWCAMERCGNRQKIRAMRARQKPTGG